MKKHHKREQSEAPRYKKEKTPAVKQTEIAMSSTVRDKVDLRRECLVSLFLVVMVLIPYGQVLRFDFVSFDDGMYIAENARVSAGLTYENIIWAFTTGAEVANWHPVTWLSYLFDAQLFGSKNAAAFHLINVLFHAINSVLLFLLLHRMTRGLWASMLVAALFAIHPLHVESVAWISERKDVLSTSFWLLTMIAYLRYVASPGFRYLLVVLPFVLGLMSKPMLVTLPAVLLLMDYWPLRRLEGVGSLRGRPVPRWQWLVVEKLPLFALVVVSSLVTVVMQERGQSVMGFEALPFWLRAANAVVAYGRYVAMTVMPMGLTVFYPHPGIDLPFWQILVSGAFLVSVSVGVVRWRKTRPYLFVGWLWYLGTLVPVIGLVQVGSQALADRYTYVPLIGLFMMAVWGIQDLCVRWRVPKRALGFGIGAMLIALTVVAGLQVGHWRNSTTLFEHALKINPSNCMALTSLGTLALKQGRYEEAKTYLTKALDLKPEHDDVLDSLGLLALNQKRYDEAKTYLTKALDRNPENVDVLDNLGVLAMDQGRYEEAKAYLTKALDLNPGHVQVLYNLGGLALGQKRYEEANAYLTKALDLDPGNFTVLNNLGGIAMNQGRYDAAKAYLTKALDLNPKHLNALNNLGCCLVNQGQYEQAEHHFRKAIEIDPQFVAAMNSLGSVLAQLGRQEEANGYLKRAAELNQAASAK